MIVSIALWVAAAVAIRSETENFRSAAWKLGVPAMAPPFSDARYVAFGWTMVQSNPTADIFSLKIPVRYPEGIVPMPFNYPPWLLLPADLGASLSWYPAIGWIVCAVFVLAVAVAVPVRRWWQGGLLAFLIVSPPTMLGLERGNVDLVIFAAIAVAAVVYASAKGQRGAGAVALMFFGGAIKLHGFPGGLIFAAGKPVSRSAIHSLVYLSAASIFLLSPWSGLSTAYGNAPQDVYWSTGARQWALALERSAGLSAHILELSDGTRQWGIATGLIAILLGAAVGLLVRNRLPCQPRSAPWMLAIAGSAHFICSYVLILSYMYRKITLLLLLPLLFSLMVERGMQRWVGMSAGVLLAAAFGIHFHPVLALAYEGPPAAEVVRVIFVQAGIDFLLVVLLVTLVTRWLAEIAPEWMRAAQELAKGLGLLRMRAEKQSDICSEAR